MLRYTIALALVGLLSLGATFAAVEPSANTGGWDCEWWGIAGEDDGSNVVDRCRGASQGEGDNATLVNNAVCTNANVQTGFTTAKRSCDFDGTDDHMSIPDGSMGDWLSICAWIAPDTDGDQYVANHYNFLGAGGHALHLVDTGSPEIKFANAAGGWGATTGDSAVGLTNSWTFGCSTWDGAINTPVTMYSSGLSDSSKSLLDCGTGGNACATAVLAYGNPTPDYLIGILVGNFLDFKGQIGEVSAWDTELSAEQVCLICRCGPSNGQFTPDVTNSVKSNRDSHGDRLNECNACTLPTNVTHCGPRRVM